jgi:hypothetical protein
MKGKEVPEMKVVKVRRNRGRVGRPRKAKGEKAVPVKIWIAGRDLRTLAASAKARKMTVHEYILGLIRDDVAHALAGHRSGPVTNVHLLEALRSTLDATEDLARAAEQRMKGGTQ